LPGDVSGAGEFCDCSSVGRFTCGMSFFTSGVTACSPPFTQMPVMRSSWKPFFLSLTASLFILQDGNNVQAALNEQPPKRTSER
jgi:hypothetical protein